MITTTIIYMYIYKRVYVCVCIYIKVYMCVYVYASYMLS